MKAYFELARPRQWIKNLFCLGGLFFGGHLFAWPLVLKAGLVAAAFCCLSSAVYAFNDVFDRDGDRRHPRKRDRPVAAGRVPVRGALIFAAVLLVAGFALLGGLGSEFGATALAAGIYVGLNLLYTLRLKSVPLIDVNVIALGFVMRVAAGAFAIPVEPTRWILFCTFFLALFVAFGKRRAELAEAGEGRAALAGYDAGVLDAGLRVCAVIVVATYALYCLLSPEHEGYLVLITVLPVIAGVGRYWKLAREGERAVAPEVLVFRDGILAASALSWVAMFGWVIYAKGS